MKQIFAYLLFVALLPMLGGCDESDDVAEIFTGKTWKLTYITMNGQTYDFWNGDEAAYDRSEALRRQGATFTVVFNGNETETVVEGDFEARAVNCTLTGTWSADGATHEVRTSNIRSTGSDTDVLARAFLTGLRNPTRYEGDSQNLYIYYKDGQTTKCMAFHIQ